MSSTLGAALLTVSLTANVTGADKPALPHNVIEGALKTAGCTVAPSRAAIVGTERLGPHLGIVEVRCWQTEANSGSILFAVPDRHPEQAQLLTVESWQGGRVRQTYSIAAPGYDAQTRTLSSTKKARNAGDCGTIQEMKWTGWHFRLLNAWDKRTCDGEAFEWDSRDKWQVFPARAPQSEPDDSGTTDKQDFASR
jgi:hypothetical protein